MKNHFIFGFAGNKREEVERIVEHIKDISNVSIVVEPFCGTSALSYYLSTKYPKKFKYILNDNNKHLVELYNIMKSKRKLKAFEKKINEIAASLNSKADYLKVIKEDDHIGYYISHRIKCIKAGLFPLDYKYKYINVIDCPIIKFLQTENVELLCKNGIDIIKEHKDNSKAFIFLDPPYLMSCNDFYGCPDVNIYEYLCNNSISLMKSTIIAVLEKNWIINLLFRTENKVEYDKRYSNNKKKKNYTFIN